MGGQVVLVYVTAAAGEAEWTAALSAEAQGGK